jgi:sulfur relay (sulfurtransferase) DsrC/TusE family protein
MNHAQNTMMHDGEIPMYDAVKDLSKEDLERTVRENASARNFALNNEHMEVIHTLVDHYREDCKTRDCLAAHEHIRFLEDAYESRGGSKYLYMLFDIQPDMHGVLVPIHDLAGLPALRLEMDKGFGTAF